jgi:hypothetical protein
MVNLERRLGNNCSLVTEHIHTLIPRACVIGSRSASLQLVLSLAPRTTLLAINSIWRYQRLLLLSLAILQFPTRLRALTITLWSGKEVLLEMLLASLLNPALSHGVQSGGA